MSDLLATGASGVRAYQTALTTISENIANAGTAGYSRRATALKEVVAPGGVSASTSVGTGMGVVVNGIVRSADTFRAADVRSSSADLARSETGVAWLDRIQTALTGNQLGDRLTGFFNAAQAIAADPTASTPRAAFLEAGTSVANAFSATGKALDQVSADLDGTAENAVTTLSGLGTALAKVNDGLGRTAAGSNAAAALADQRDQILEQMSAITDVSVSTDAAGRASVRLGTATGPVLVAGNDAGAVTYVRSDEGAVSFAIHRDGTSVALVPSGGALAGITDGAQRIVAARAQLNTIATAFGDGVNAVQAQGRDLDGNPGAAMFAAGDTPTDLTLALTDPRGVAAASVGAGTRDNGNLKALGALRTAGAFEGNTTGLISDNAAALASRQQIAEAQSAIRDGAVAARDSVSGVNLDSEAVNLMRFQQAYSASSRVIQVARETLQSILDIR
ncbi:MAG: flgK [Sphingomonas bacterium]|uniref:flagellar hook-associated protein FlgK n=1 Tax=Sphingomonas bacterium TaxID=1895847 RepID=UPI00260EBCC6|nr:flagellar hook-associated protein FlgK [Sphingomonas bacterium]MDB5703474.1 flgK [Sphingomonas bacterium]